MKNRNILTSQFKIGLIILTIALLTGLANKCISQDIHNLSVKHNTLVFEKQYTYDSLNADQIFDKTKLWFVETFKNPKEAINAEVKPSIIKGTFYSKYTTSMGKMEQEFLNDIEVKIKDGAIKVVITNIRQLRMNWGIETITVKGDTFKTGAVALKSLDNIQSKCLMLSENLNEFIQKKISDW